MGHRGRALYNLLSMNVKRHPQLDVEPWQVENYRVMSEKVLFSRLKELGIHLSKNAFLLAVDKVETPEELTERLYQGDEFVCHQRIFLCLFELWRRFAHHKRPLSVFCDALDHLIEQYEEGNLECEGALEEMLVAWQGVLEDHVDEGGERDEALPLFSEFSCHDLERFVYEYVAHRIALEDDLYASELLEGFYDFVQEPHWFDFLRVRLVFNVDREEGKVMVERLLEVEREAPNLQLLFEVLHFLIYAGELDLFYSVFRRAFERITNLAELHDWLLIASEYMNCSEQFTKEEEINQLIEKKVLTSPDTQGAPPGDLLNTLRSWLFPKPCPPFPSEVTEH